MRDSDKVIKSQRGLSAPLVGDLIDSVNFMGEWELIIPEHKCVVRKDIALRKRWDNSIEIGGHGRSG